MTRATLLDLADRCEKAERADRDLFERAFVVCFGRASEEMRPGVAADWMDRWRQFSTFIDVGAWLNAAMGLVDEQWQSAIMWDRDERTAVACVGPNALAGFVLGKGEAKGLNALDTKARALTAASLRARASMENPA